MRRVDGAQAVQRGPLSGFHDVERTVVAIERRALYGRLAGDDGGFGVVELGRQPVDVRHRGVAVAL